MEWSKLKTIVLLILVVTNLSLLAFVVQRNVQQHTADRRNREDTISFLAQQGITLDESTLPTQMERLPQVVERDLVQEQQTAAALLGEDTRTDALGGEVYRYTSPKGYLQVHGDGSFSGEFLPGVFPQSNPQLGKDALAVLNTLGMEGEVLSSQVTADSKNCATVTVRQSWDGVPIFHHLITLSYKDGALVSIQNGRRLLGSPKPDPTRRPMAPATALIRFYQGLTQLGDVCSRIDEITWGYVAVSTAGTGSSTLTPVWYVMTDTGGYLLDTLTGEVSRLEDINQNERE